MTSIYEFYDEYKLGVITNYFCSLIPNTRLIEHKIDKSVPSAPRIFIFGTRYSFFYLRILNNDEVEIAPDTSGGRAFIHTSSGYKEGPPNGEYHAHINVHSKETSENLKIYLIEKMRDIKLKSILR